MGAVKSTVSSLRQVQWRSFIIDECMVVTVPREVAIQNHRMGVVLRIAQVVVVVALVFYCWIEEVWKASFKPEGYGVRFVYLDISEQAPSAAQVSTASYCKKPATEYWFNSSFHGSFKPDGCETLPPHRAAFEFVDRLFVATYVEEITYWRATTCNTSMHQVCHELLGEAGLESLGTVCACTGQRGYFVRDVEQKRISVFHGYEVDTSNGKGLWVSRGSTGSESQVVGSREGGMNEESGEMLTYLITPQGEPCTVSGRSEWRHSDTAEHGISGTLSEWLACAGVTLDTDPKILLPDPSFAHNVRIMGSTLLFTLDYSSEPQLLGSRNVRCTVSVELRVAWTAMPSTWTSDRISQQASIGEGFEVDRVYRGNGIVMKARVIGNFNTFSLERAISALVNFIVLFTLPLQFTQFVALYCLGTASEMYRRARRTKLSAYNHFQNAVVRTLIAEISFRGLVGGKFRGSIAEMGLTPKQLLNHLSDLFADQKGEGLITSDELQNMTALTFKHLDHGGKGHVSCADFVRSASRHEFFDVHMMARFFSSRTSRGVLQSVLDNSHARRNKSIVSTASKDLLNRLSVGDDHSDDGYGSDRVSSEWSGGQKEVAIISAEECCSEPECTPPSPVASNACAEEAGKAFATRNEAISQGLEDVAIEVKSVGSQATLQEVVDLRLPIKMDVEHRIAALEALHFDHRIVSLEVRIGQLDVSVAEVNQRLNLQHEKYHTWTEALATRQTASEERQRQTVKNSADNSNAASAMQKLCEIVETAEARLHQLEQEVATMQMASAKAPSSSWAPSMCDSSLLEARELVCSAEAQAPDSSSGPTVPHSVLLPPCASPPRAAPQPRVARELLSAAAGSRLTSAMLTPRTDLLGGALFRAAAALTPRPDDGQGPADPGELGSPRPSLSPPKVHKAEEHLSRPARDSHSQSRTPGSTVASSSASAVFRLNKALTPTASRRGSRSSSLVAGAPWGTVDINEMGQETAQRSRPRRTVAC